MRSYRITAYGAPLHCVETVTPRPKGEEVLLRVVASGVCHTDVHLWQGGYDLGHGRKIDMQARGIPLPLTPGHEIVGEIVALGPDARERRIGERCLIYAWIGCGHCTVCTVGEENLCMAPRAIGVHRDGGYADHVVVPHARYCLPIGDLDPAEVAALGCAGLTAYSALRRLGRMLNEGPVVLIGGGGLGLMALRIANAVGKGAVVLDIDPAKRALAMTAGAQAAIDGARSDAVQAIHAIIGGAPAGVVDFVANPATAQLGFDCLRKGGKLVLAGLFGGAAPWPLPLIPLRAISIEGAYAGTLTELGELLALFRSGAVQPIPVERYPLSAASRVLLSVSEGGQLGRGILVPDI